MERFFETVSLEREGKLLFLAVCSLEGVPCVKQGERAEGRTVFVAGLVHQCRYEPLHPWLYKCRRNGRVGFKNYAEGQGPGVRKCPLVSLYSVLLLCCPRPAWFSYCFTQIFCSSFDLSLSLAWSTAESQHKRKNNAAVFNVNRRIFYP